MGCHRDPDLQVYLAVRDSGYDNFRISAKKERIKRMLYKGLLVWGGRKPIPELTLGKLKERTESLVILHKPTRMDCEPGWVNTSLLSLNVIQWNFSFTVNLNRNMR